jgi:hypothetical protein
MLMSDIIDLQEVFPNHWHAKYQENYGIYFIKITIDVRYKFIFFTH